MREILTIEQLMDRPVVPDDDPIRQSECVRIYHRVRRGRSSIEDRLLNEILSEEKLPTEDYKDWAFYLDLFENIWLTLYSDISHKFPTLKSSIQPANEQDNYLDETINLDRMRIDVKALNYANKYLGMKDTK